MGWLRKDLRANSEAADTSAHISGTNLRKAEKVTQALKAESFSAVCVCLAVVVPMVLTSMCHLFWCLFLYKHFYIGGSNTSCLR